MYCYEFSEIYAKIAYNKPRSCEAMNLACNNMIASWGLGINGICLNEDVGIRVGPQGVTVAVLRVCIAAQMYISILFGLGLFYWDE